MVITPSVCIRVELFTVVRCMVGPNQSDLFIKVCLVVGSCFAFLFPLPSTQ